MTKEQFEAEIHRYLPFLEGKTKTLTTPQGGEGWVFWSGLFHIFYTGDWEVETPQAYAQGKTLPLALASMMGAEVSKP